MKTQIIASLSCSLLLLLQSCNPADSVTSVSSGNLGVNLLSQQGQDEEIITAIEKQAPVINKKMYSHNGVHEYVIKAAMGVIKDKDDNKMSSLSIKRFSKDELVIEKDFISSGKEEFFLNAVSDPEAFKDALKILNDTYTLSITCRLNMPVADPITYVQLKDISGNVIGGMSKKIKLAYEKAKAINPNYGCHVSLASTLPYLLSTSAVSAQSLRALKDYLNLN